MEIEIDKEIFNEEEIKKIKADKIEGIKYLNETKTLSTNGRIEERAGGLSSFMTVKEMLELSLSIVKYFVVLAPYIKKYLRSGKPCVEIKHKKTTYFIYPKHNVEKRLEEIKKDIMKKK